MNTTAATRHLFAAVRAGREACVSLLPIETRDHLARARYEFGSFLANLVDPGDPPQSAPASGDTTGPARSRRINIEEDE